MESNPILLSSSRALRSQSSDQGGRPRRRWLSRCRSTALVVAFLMISVIGGVLVLLYYLINGQIRTQPHIFTTLYSSTVPMGALISRGLRSDGHDSLCVTLPDQHMISCLAESGDLRRLTGGPAGYRDGSMALAQFNGPLGVAWDPDDRVLFVADRRNDRVRAVDLGADLVWTVPAPFRAPHSLAPYPRTGGVFVADGPLSNATIWSVTRSGNKTALMSDLSLSADDGDRAGSRLATDRVTGFVYVAASTAIWRLDPESGARARLTSSDLDRRLGSGLVGVVADGGAVFAFSEEAIIAIGGDSWSGFYDTCPKDAAAKPVPAAAIAALARNRTVTHFIEHDDPHYRLLAAVQTLCRGDNPQQ